MILKENTSLQSGKYRIIRVLGQGGFGITYLAEHTSLDKLVAIKEFFPKDFCTRNESDNSVIITGSNAELIDRLRKRFMKEAKNIAKLDHPGIVKIHDVFQENGIAYYVMDYIKGDNLSSIVAQNGPLTEEKAIDYIVKVGEALEYMHSRKMTHFDVKPANIIIKKETDTPVLVDFGLSKLYVSDNEETSTLLQAVSSGFSPIELYNSESLTEFSPQSDVYSLAATFYFLVTGAVMPNAVSITSVIKETLEKLPGHLIGVMGKALSFNKANRWESIECFLSSFTSSMNIVNIGSKEPIYILYWDLKFISKHHTQLYRKRIYDNDEEAYNYYAERARNGSSEYQNYLGCMYEFGQGTSVNQLEAYRWYKLASLKNAEAMYNLGRLTELGIGCAKNIPRALELYKKSIDNGFVIAMIAIGAIYENRNEYEEAILWYNKAIESGCTIGYAWLGNLYQEGLGVKKDIDKAIRLYTTGIQNGCTYAMTLLGLLYSQEEERYDLEKALYWFRKASKMHNNWAMIRLACLLIKTNKSRTCFLEAIYWIITAINSGCSIGMSVLGNILLEEVEVGSITIKEDYDEAFKLLSKSANLTCTKGMVLLAKMYRDGFGVKMDYSKAIEWLKQAAYLDDPEALRELALMHRGGVGVTIDTIKATELFQKAADLGDIDSFDHLAYMYYLGDGVKKDYAKAAELFQRSADAGIESSRDKLEELYYFGKGVEKNTSRAIEYYRQKAEKGCESVYIKLGDMYYWVNDYSNAVKWYQKAADLGHPFGLNNLANRYFNGEGVKKNIKKAFDYYVQAAEHGHHGSLEVLKKYKFRYWIYSVFGL